MPREQIHFVTGRLAEHALGRLLEQLAPQVGFDYSVQVMGISVAALLTPSWIAPRLRVPQGTTRLLLPGYCEGDLAPLKEVFPLTIERGPRDLFELPDYFGRPAGAPPPLDAYRIEILAEINHARRLTLAELRAQAAALRDAGADVIDLGCAPGDCWYGVADAVRALADDGHRVSIDSLNPLEIAPAVRAGAELVLSVNATNVAAAADWAVEVVAIPDEPGALGSLEATLERLDAAGVPYRIDPILEPIGLGFAASLERYWAARHRWPQAPMMMGIGNLTELTDADSAGLNVLLLGFCEELSVTSVLTTQVINWARSSVRECDLARRLVHYAISNRTLPKHRAPELVVLRDPKLFSPDEATLEQLASQIKDHDLRIFVAGGKLHLVGAGLHVAGDDPFELFDALLARQPPNLTPAHAFYLGYELSKAVTASTLGKQYTQDEALRWGFLTRPESSHRIARHEAHGRARAAQRGPASPEENPPPLDLPAAPAVADRPPEKAEPGASAE